MLITMWSAIFLRMTPIFSMRTFSPGANAGGGAIGEDGRPAAGACADAVPRAAPPLATNASMSFFVTRPEMPVPFSRVMSMLFALAILRTTGEDLMRRRSASVCGTTGTAGDETDGAAADMAAALAGAAAASDAFDPSACCVLPVATGAAAPAAG